MRTLEPWELRLCNDFAELKEKFHKLDAYVIENPEFHTLGKDQKKLLQEQHLTMGTYLGTLRARIQLIDMEKSDLTPKEIKLGGEP